ncbi:Alpha/Beta hydrolase protein [Xylariaceae sp. FL0594]|nr:Alpha/Beta hydrolase protein [Xylariaceae sp. FL0594]
MATRKQFCAILVLLCASTGANAFLLYLGIAGIGLGFLAHHLNNNYNISFPLPEGIKTTLDLYGAPENDFNCKPFFPPSSSKTTPHNRNPVIMLHGLFQNRNNDLHLLQRALNARGYCTYSLTYGSYTSWFPFLNQFGGMKNMTHTAGDIANFIREVVRRTGAEKVDVVGHSEGAVQALYVPLATQQQEGDISSHIDKIIALSPALHGARYWGFADLWYVGGEASRAFIGWLVDNVFMCPACEQMVKDGDIYTFFKENVFDPTTSSRGNKAEGERRGKIARAGNKITIIMSRTDTLVPAAVSEVRDDDNDVRLVYVQDTCPDDRVGHFGLSWDTSVWRLVANALEETDEEVWPCGRGVRF